MVLETFTEEEFLIVELSEGVVETEKELLVQVRNKQHTH